MANDDMKELQELRLDRGGRWVVLSSSATVYRLDLDRRLLRREPGPGSQRAEGDDRWVPLVEVSTYVPSAEEVLTRDTSRDDVVTVGCRHLYLLEPAPGTLAPYQWWLQRVVTRIVQDSSDVDDEVV